MSLDRLVDALDVLEDVECIKDKHLGEAWRFYNEEKTLRIHAEAIEPLEDTDSAADEEGEGDGCSDWLEGMLVVVGGSWCGVGR